MISQRLLHRFYPPDRGRDGTRRFYDWVREDLGPDSVLLNLGAGPPTGDPVRRFRGEVARVVGADIDPVVLENPELDEGVLIRGGRIPIGDGTFDAAVCDYVFEHVEHPYPFLRETCRVLKPGAPLFFRTPTRWHYVSIVSSVTPHWFHVRVANRMRGLAKETHDPWKTHYRMNSARLLRRQARECGFGAVELRFVEADPSYLRFHPIPFLLGVAYERIVNRFAGLSSIRANIFGRLERAGRS